MSDLDLSVVIVLFVGVAGLGYALGRKGTTAPREAEPAKAKAPEIAHDHDHEKPTVEKPTVEEPAVEKQPEAAPRTSDKPGTLAPTAYVVPKLYTEEEAEADALDVTRVGSAATGPAGAVKRTTYQPPLERIVYDEGADIDEEPKAESLFLVHATAQTDTGLRRKQNEDSLLVLEAANLYVVADGMGGYHGGELASQLTIKTMAAAATDESYEGTPHEGFPAEASELARAIQMANAEIQELAAGKRQLEGMGTTVCAARFSPTKKRLYIGHVGDSRCYRLRDGVFKAMTEDHTMAGLGVSGPESAHLSRAVGIWPTVPIDILMAVPQPGDVYLLCSDGLTKMLPDESIAQVLRAEEDPKAAVDRLIFFANSRGGKDNITVVLIRVVPPSWKPQPGPSLEAEMKKTLLGTG